MQIRFQLDKDDIAGLVMTLDLPEQLIGANRTCCTGLKGLVVHLHPAWSFLLFSVWRASSLRCSLSSFSFLLAAVAACFAVSLSASVSQRHSSSFFFLKSSSVPLCLQCLVLAPKKASIKLVARSLRVRVVTLANFAGKSLCRVEAMPSQQADTLIKGALLPQLHATWIHHL